MNYTIIDKNDDGTLVEVSISEQRYRTLVVCNEGELDSAVEIFVQSITDPIQPKPQEPQPNLQQQIDALKAEVAALQAAK